MSDMRRREFIALFGAAAAWRERPRWIAKVNGDKNRKIPAEVCELD